MQQAGSLPLLPFTLLRPLPLLALMHMMCVQGSVCLGGMREAGAWLWTSHLDCTTSTPSKYCTWI